MDIQMPEMDGLEATRRIRAGEVPAARSIAIVAVSANALSGDRERFIAAGMDDYVSKPIRRELLFDVLARVTERAAAGASPAGESEGA